jgi:adenylate cyclase
MAIEIERKFLVKNTNFKNQAEIKMRITQGFLSSVAERTVRIRIKEDKAYITVKGISNKSGTSRYEWEKEIPVHEAKELLKLCEPGIIDKTRYLIKQGKHIFEVDEFHGANKGLIVAEIELDNENEIFEKPEWLGKEVTGDTKYYNARLSRNPYKNWKSEKNNNT